jgi:DMSO/TMAO reductase YedYZ molybdopterin-dependent catalytic subunit
VVSLQTRGGYRVSELGREHARDPLTLLALTLNGEELSPDHGYPVRLIAPNRPGALQTKWVGRLEVLS